MIRAPQNGPRAARARRRRAVVFTWTVLLFLVASAAFAFDWFESFRRAFHTSSGANHISVAAHGDRAILAGKYAVDVLSFDPTDESWKLDFRINENASPGGFADLPAVAVDAARVAYARREPLSRSSWEVRARFHFDQPNEWKSIINGIPGPVWSLDFTNNTRAIVGYGSPQGSWGARIYEYNGTSFQHVATMDLGLPLSNTGLIAAIDGDFAVSIAHQEGDSWLVAYRWASPGKWLFHQAIPLPGVALSLDLHGDWLVAGSPFGDSAAYVYRRQGRLDYYQLDQTLSSPSAGASVHFGYDVGVIDDEIYVSDWFETIAGYSGQHHGAVHRFVHHNGNWQPSLRLVSSQGENLETLGVLLSVTTDHVLATGGLDNGTFYSFDRPGVP